MSTHDVLAYAVATAVVSRVRSGASPWSSRFSSNVYVTSSRAWPVPDFVLVDSDRSIHMAAEFKPPKQSKREYLTGLGQAVAYSRDFHYGLLVLPEIADDGYRIADHVVDVLGQDALQSAPVGVLTYDPSSFTPLSPVVREVHFFPDRAAAPSGLVALDTSFYAKWREMSPHEIFLLMSYCYDEMRSPSAGTGTIRDRAFDKLWAGIQAGSVLHWRRAPRTAASKTKTAVGKNYRNFLFHVGWTEADGALTREGLEAHHTGALYGAWSRPFLDAIALAVLSRGKHLIFINAINEYQDALAAQFPAEAAWLVGLEDFLEDKGLLKRNPARAAAATRGQVRGFLKAEKQLWKELELIVPNGARVYHPNRGFIFNWSRIGDLLQIGG